jgi:hypothetical protein
MRGGSAITRTSPPTRKQRDVARRETSAIAARVGWSGGQREQRRGGTGRLEGKLAAVGISP